jgi:dTDP-4-dehydrorhamnose reductase
LLHLSTDYVFDGTSRRPYHDYDRPRPLSIYGASKLAGKEAVRTHNPRHYIVRTAWLSHTVGRNFPKTMCGLATEARYQAADAKRLYYLSMEFLMGQSLSNNLYNLHLLDK